MFIDGRPDIYSSVMLPTAWWANIMQQTTLRALTKLEFAYGLAMGMAEAVNDVTPQTIEMLGELSGYVEVTRNAVLLAEEHGYDRGDGVVFPDGRPLHPMRAMLADLVPSGQRHPHHDRQPQPARDAEQGDARRCPAPAAHRRVPATARTTSTPRTGRRSTDSRGTSSARTSGARNDLYERNYLASARTNRTGAHMVYADHERPKALVEAMLAAGRC